MGIKKGTWDEHWVLYVNDESLDSTAERLYYMLINLDLNKIKNKKDEISVAFALKNLTAH